MAQPNVQTVRLAGGCHSGPAHRICVMELASMLADEPFSDHPRSVSAPLAALLRGYNDGLDDARRQSLKGFAAASVGTAGNRVADRQRRRLARACLARWRGASGLRARWAVRRSCTDTMTMGAEIGLRVRNSNDDELHARMLELIHAMIAVGATHPPVIAPPAQLKEEVLVA